MTVQREIRHASAFKPISVPVLADVDMANWDRVQSFTATTTQPEEKLYELGRRDKMTTHRQILEATASMTQFEYGEIDSFLQLSGLLAEPSGGFELDDFDAPRLDFICPGKERYGGTLEQTLWTENMALNSFEIAINADDQIERSFEFAGEYAKIARNANKCIIFKTNDAPSGTDGSYVITLDDPVPVIDPNTSVYILKLYRIRDGEAELLSLTTDYTYSNVTNNLTVLAASTGDHYRIWYSASSYGSAGDPQALNDEDAYYLSSENVTITIDDGTHTPLVLDKATSFSISASFNRTNQAVIGTVEKLKDTESYDVSISIDQFVKNYLLQEACAGQAGEDWGIIDYSTLAEVDVIVEIFSNALKTEFVMGYKVENASLGDDTPADFSANANGTNSSSLSSDNLLITKIQGNL